MGASRNVPAWAVDLAIAEEWGIPPWEVEKAPALWIDRWLAYHRAQNDAQKMKSKQKAGSSVLL